MSYKKFISICNESLISNEGIMDSIVNTLKKIGQSTGLLQNDIIIEMSSEKYNCSALMSYLEKSSNKYHMWFTKEVNDFLTIAFKEKDVNKAKSELDKQLKDKLNEIRKELSNDYKAILAGVSGQNEYRIKLSSKVSLSDLINNDNTYNIINFLKGYRHSFLQSDFSSRDDVEGWILTDWLSKNEIEYDEHADELDNLYDKIAYSILTKYNKEIYNEGCKLLDPIEKEINVVVYREGSDKNGPDVYDKKQLVDLFNKIGPREWEQYKILDKKEK